jgi:hypothetical protein
MGVEMALCKDKSRKSQPSDWADIRHLALLPYVDVFVTEKALAEMIRQGAPKDLVGRVHRSLERWLSL